MAVSIYSPSGQLIRRLDLGYRGPGVYVSRESGAYWDGSKYGYRTGYYTYDKNMKYIVWGQFTQFLTEKEYNKLLTKARAKGWPI